MNATWPTNRCYDSPDLKGKSSPPPVILPEPEPAPVGPTAKRDAFSQGVFEAVQLLRTHLRHPDVRVAQKAAITLVGMQNALLRHGGGLMGTVLPDQVTPLEPLDELSDARYGQGPTDEEYDAMSEEELEIRTQGMETLRIQMQREADRRGYGEFVSLAQVQYEYKQCVFREQIRRQFPDGFLPTDRQTHQPPRRK